MQGLDGLTALRSPQFHAPRSRWALPKASGMTKDTQGQALCEENRTRLAMRSYARFGLTSNPPEKITIGRFA